MSHSTISHAILYWGILVVLITSENENILRTGHYVIKLPDDTIARHINLLATTTGTKDGEISSSKRSRNYRHVKYKRACADLTPPKSDLIRPARIFGCPDQKECDLAKGHMLMGDYLYLKGAITAIEFKVLRVHISDHLRMLGHLNRISSGNLRPIFMCFQEFYGFREGMVAESVLGIVNEEKYRGITRSTEEAEKIMKRIEEKSSNGY
ncbi:hypothetical protein ACQKWADRAFT_321348 [Trichoderma austrokoningii]